MRESGAGHSYGFRGFQRTISDSASTGWNNLKTSIAEIVVISTVSERVDTWEDSKEVFMKAQENSLQKVWGSPAEDHWDDLYNQLNA